MADQKLPLDGLSFRRIVGFACSQSFVISVFHLGMGLAGEGAFPGASIGGRDLICALAFLFAGFILLLRLPEKARFAVLSRPALVFGGALMAAAFLCPAGLPQAVRIGADCVLGACCSLQIAAWGRSFGALETEGFLVEVLAGFLLGALLCLLFSLSSQSGTLMLMAVFPIASAVWIDGPQEPGVCPVPVSEDLAIAQMLSVKVMCGTFCFGLSMGLIGGVSSTGDWPDGLLSALLFAAFLVGTLSIVLSDGFGKGDSLNKSYRLSVFLFLAGILAVSLSGRGEFPVEGDDVMLAGFLGLQAILACLFLTVSRLCKADGAVAFASGFACLFGGQAAGLVVSTGALPALAAPSYLPIVFAGLIALAACIFLFTERDFDSISKTVAEDDRFEASCASIAADFGLSKREAQVLPLVLRGRTSSRIAEELGISKSTVDTHLRHIYSKCGVSGKQGLIDLREGR
ncbi:MAG: helix-turn-helix transcriptional regulator [Eggerthellaceae bacterium]